MPDEIPPLMFNGVPVARGIACARAYVIEDPGSMAAPRRTIAATEVDAEIARLHNAVLDAEKTLLDLQKNVLDRIGKEEAAIFDAQLLLLHDPSFLKHVTDACSEQKINIEAALADVIERVTAMFAQIDDVYLRERAADIRDVGRRVLGLLLKSAREETFEFSEGVIVVAAELLPSTTARMNLQSVRGIVTERGGKTSHASILTRSLGIPGVVGVTDITVHVKSGDVVIVDGSEGTVHVNPRPEVAQEYEQMCSAYTAHQTSLKKSIDLPATTSDGVHVKLSANIGNKADAEAAVLYKAEGVGLYRTEFNFFIRDKFPTEEEQYQIYTAIAEMMHPMDVVMRILDIGSDKMLPYFALPQETNPSLGRRGMRLLLKHPEVLHMQLRAILRVSASHPVAVLFPMISGVEELLEAKGQLDIAKQQLQAAGKPFNSEIPVGAMIEIPSAAVVAQTIASKVDFMSVGTNDLIQYLLGADRGSHEMAEYYRPLHPAVLQMLKTVIEAGRSEARPISICGKMAGDPAFTELLLGLGVRSFSVSPDEILEVKNAVRSTSMPWCEQMAQQVMEMETASEVEEFLARVA